MVNLPLVALGVAALAVLAVLSATFRYIPNDRVGPGLGLLRAVRAG
jgi:hypothetical protein